MDTSKCFVSGSFSDDEASDVDSNRDPEDADAKQTLAAAEKGSLDKLKALIEADPDLVNATDKEGYTALHRACYANHVEVVTFLLKNGANIVAKTEFQWQPLHSCCRWGHVDCAIVLLNEGADINAVSEGGQTPLHIAATYATCYDMVQLLLFHPLIDPNVKNNSGETAADIARRSSKFYNVFDMSDPLLDLKD